MNDKLKNILNMVSEYIDEKHAKNQWSPNKDWVK